MNQWWIQTGVAVQKRPIWVNTDDFVSRLTLKFNRWYWKTIGHLSLATSSLVCHFIAICDFNLSNGPETATLAFDLCDLDLWPLTLTSPLSLVITPEIFMMIRWWEYDEKGVTDGRTDGRTDGLNHSQSCLVAAKIDKQIYRWPWNSVCHRLLFESYYHQNTNWMIMAVYTICWVDSHSARAVFAVLCGFFLFLTICGTTNNVVGSYM